MCGVREDIAGGAVGNIRREGGDLVVFAATDDVFAGPIDGQAGEILGVGVPGGWLNMKSMRERESRRSGRLGDKDI